MQKYKKLLSVLLAMVMTLSVISAGLVAGAQELLDDTSVIDAAEPVEEAASEPESEAFAEPESEAFAEPESEAISESESEAVEEPTDEEKIAAFEKLVADAKTPCTDEYMAKLVAAYKELPSDYANEEVANAYASIILAYAKNWETPDVSGFNKTDVTYPTGASYEKVTAEMPKFDNFVNELFVQVAGGNLTDLVNGNLYTNAMVGKIASTLYEMIGSIDISGMDFFLQMILGSILKVGVMDIAEGQYGFTAEEIGEEGPYRGAYQALKNAWTAYNNAGSNKGEKYMSWQYAEFNNGDWFLDGDKEGFVQAISVLFRPFQIAMMVMMLADGNPDLEKGTYTFGIYSEIVPIFEALGIDCPSSDEYSKRVSAEMAVDPHNMDALQYQVKPIVEIVCDFIDKFAAAPVTVLCDTLPKLAYALENNLLNEQIAKILGKIKMISIDPSIIDLSTTNIFDLIAGIDDDGDNNITIDVGSKNSLGEPNYPDGATLTIKIQLADKTTDETGNTIPAKYTTLTLKEKDFVELMKDLAGCGEMEIASSGSANAFRANLVSDKADAFVTLMRYVYDDVLIPNRTAVNDVINALAPDQAAVINTVLGPVLEIVAKALPADAFIVALVNIVEPSLPDFGDIELPDIGIEGGLDEIFGTIGDFVGGIISGDSPIGGIISGIIDFIKGLFGGDDNPDTPNTPDDDNGFDNDDDDNFGDVDEPTIPNTAGSKTLASVLVFGLLGGLGAGAGACVYKFKKDDEE